MLADIGPASKRELPKDHASNKPKELNTAITVLLSRPGTA
ncbi:hypothetical protein C900_04295 [Fulvivirga imtechensis AK7]|uniref:Uncharacterized protein n=1 Tax=Fulvivirga imtechensis AK7 TaxID=1237149 RepID=L8JZ37_9BACT|nr:hypothetical protein C900_04295 [Fulvivirga imtechensis AK7]